MIFIIFLILQITTTLRLATSAEDAMTTTAKDAATADAFPPTITTIPPTEKTLATPSSDVITSKKPKAGSKSRDSVDSKQKAMLITFTAFLVIFVGLMVFIYVL